MRITGSESLPSRFGVVRHLAAEKGGSAAAEFALVVPILSLVLFAIVKFGLAYNQQLALTDGVRVSLRQLAVSRSTATAWTDTTNRFYGATPALNRSNVTLSVSVNGVDCSSDSACRTALSTAAGQPATLVASYPCDLNIVGFDVAPGCTLSARTTERVE